MVWWNTAQYSFLSSPFTSPSMGVKQVRQERRKKKKGETGIHSSCKETTTASFFNLPSDGPDDSSGQARWMKRSVWGGGVRGAYQGTRHRYLLETARRCLCASENSHSHCWARWETEAAFSAFCSVLHKHLQCLYSRILNVS